MTYDTIDDNLYNGDRNEEDESMVQKGFLFLIRTERTHMSRIISKAKTITRAHRFGYQHLCSSGAYAEQHAAWCLKKQRMRQWQKQCISIFSISIFLLIPS
eukprot:149155_1